MSSTTRRTHRNAAPLRSTALAIVLSLAGGPFAPARAEWNFQTNSRALAFGIFNNPAMGPMNPGNILGFTDQEYQLHIRPDLFLNGNDLEVMAKPRAIINYTHIGDGVRSGESDTHSTFFVNEWRVRAHVTDTLFASVGRENLQWGPSYLLSVSNPFLSSNGRTRPQFEVPGIGVGKLLWLPAKEWAVTAIANTDPGRVQDFGLFRDTYALKVDYTGFEKYGSVILSRREGGPTTAGFYGVNNFNEAWLGWIEGHHTLTDLPFLNKQDSDLLLGTSYTFGNGGIFTSEIFHDDNGNASTQDFLSATTVPTIFSVPAGKDDNILLVQYNSGSSLQTQNYTIRIDHSFLDDGNRLIALYSNEINDTTELYFNGIFNFGGDTTTFGRFGDRLVVAGARVSF